MIDLATFSSLYSAIIFGKKYERCNKSSELNTYKKRKVELKPFDRIKTPPKHNLFLVPLIWLLYRFGLSGKFHINKVHERLEAVVSGAFNSSGMGGFQCYVLTLMPHRANCISELEGI